MLQTVRTFTYGQKNFQGDSLDTRYDVAVIERWNVEVEARRSDASSKIRETRGLPGFGELRGSELGRSEVECAGLQKSD